MRTTTRVQYKARFTASLWVEVDSDEVFPEDPGQGTPVMVYARDEDGRLLSATACCAINEGEVEGFELTPQMTDWLTVVNDKADEKLAPFWKGGAR